MNFRTVLGLLSLVGVSAQRTIFSGTGFGTYYYDVRQVEACDTSFAAQNSGPLECSSQKALSLNHVNSNYVVAMNHSQLKLDMSKYCGKRVVVTVNDKQSNLPLLIGDGCQRCAGGSASSDIWDAVAAPGLDFSYSVLEELPGGAACADGHIQISWEIVDDTIYSFSDDASSESAPSEASEERTTSSAALVVSTSLSAANFLHTLVNDDPVQNAVGSPTLRDLHRCDRQPPERSLPDRDMAMQRKHPRTMPYRQMDPSHHLRSRDDLSGW